MPTDQRGPGRPRIIDEDQDTLRVRVSTALIERIDAEAEECGATRSEVVRDALHALFPDEGERR